MDTALAPEWTAEGITADERPGRNVCPLQLEVIRRCVKLWSAPGETVLDMYNGIGSTTYVAVEQGRGAIGFELKESYHSQALRNVAKIQEQIRSKSGQVDLFSAAGLEVAS